MRKILIRQDRRGARPRRSVTHDRNAPGAVRLDEMRITSEAPTMARRRTTDRWKRYMRSLAWREASGPTRRSTVLRHKSVPSAHRMLAPLPAFPNGGTARLPTKSRPHGTAPSIALIVPLPRKFVGSCYAMPFASSSGIPMNRSTFKKGSSGNSGKRGKLGTPADTAVRGCPGLAQPLETESERTTETGRQRKDPSAQQPR